MPPLRLETAAPPGDPSLLPGAAAEVDEEAVIAEVREAIATATTAPSFSRLDEDALHAARRAAVDIAAATLAATSTETAEHSDDVDIIAEGVGRRLGLSGSRLEDVRVAARLHDIGKLGVPRRIIDKPGRLDPAEWAVIRRHTVIGEQILLAVPELRKAARLVRHSHERWDGKGYPDGLAGEQIPLGSRIVFCADAYHAIRSDRAYRAGRPAPEALAEIRSCAGTQFDPAVVEALEDLAFELRAIPEVRRRAAFGRSRRLMALMLVISVGACGSALARTGVIPDAKAPTGPQTGAARGSKSAGAGQSSASLTPGEIGAPTGGAARRDGRAGTGSMAGYGLLTTMPVKLAISPAQTTAAIAQTVQPEAAASGADTAVAATAPATPANSTGGDIQAGPPTNATASSGTAKSKPKKGRGSGSAQTTETGTSGSTDSSSASGNATTPPPAPTASTGNGKPKSGSEAESKSSSGKNPGKKNEANGSGTSAVTGQTDNGNTSSSGKGKKGTPQSSPGPGAPKPPKPPTAKGPKPPPPAPPQNTKPHGPPRPAGGFAPSGGPPPPGGGPGQGHG